MEINKITYAHRYNFSVHDFQTVSYYPRFLNCANNGIVGD